jgi:hypothetical protein
MQYRRPSSPRPSPPAAGGEGEIYFRSILVSLIQSQFNDSAAAPSPFAFRLRAGKWIRRSSLGGREARKH